jgi:hypothetical protein
LCAGRVKITNIIAAMRFALITSPSCEEYKMANYLTSVWYNRFKPYTQTQSSTLKGQSLKHKNHIVKFEKLNHKSQISFKSLTNGLGDAII